MIYLRLATLGVAGVLTLTGCGVAAAAPEAMTDETLALAALDVPTDAGRPSVDPSAAPHGQRRPYLRKKTLHGEITVQGKDGPRTVLVQRGVVKAVDDATVRVESSDGFALTWTLGEKAAVRTKKGELKSGAQVGVAGREDGDKSVARLVIVTG